LTCDPPSLPDFGYSGYEACTNVRYLSLSIGPTAGLCSPVQISMNDEYYLDDSGYWDT